MKLPNAFVIDIDDTGMNFSHVLMQLRRALYGVKDTVYQTQTWSLSKEQMETFRAYEAWIYARMQPKKGFKKALKRLRKKGYAIILMTARDSTFKAETIASLRYHGIISDELMFNKNKSLKINRLKERYNIVGFVDDRPETVKKVKEETKVPNVYLYDMPCNRSEEIEGVKRIKSLEEVEV